MNPEQWKRLDDLFDRARALPESGWEEFARTECGTDTGLRRELLSLLRADRESGAVLEAPIGDVGALVDAPAPGGDGLIGRKLGAYTVLSVLGQGGMGVVYEARQDSPDRIVALKVISPEAIGPSSLRRFQHEAEVLGRLQHPGIAQIYESGRAETGTGVRPFFAMELVRGRPLLEYAKEHDLNVRARLELFARVCDAVQFAHVKGVIHRDLKPGNILVDGLGQPKVLDFGIARLTDSDLRVTRQTDIGQLVGTVPYMSPEQATGRSGELDTRSDVYALGVVLYELLAGRLPYDLKGRGVPEAVRVIAEQDATRLSVVSRSLRGDVETVVAKALEKDKTRRYQSAADLAADIRRFLSDQAISARPPSTMYQLRKFARRNKALVGGVIAAFVLLVAGVIGTSIGMARAMTAEKLAKADAERAKLEARKAHKATAFLQDMINAANPESGIASNTTVAEVLKQAAAHLETELASEPEVMASMSFTLGEASGALGDYERAKAYYERALRIRSGLFGGKGAGVANCVHKLAMVAYERGDREGVIPEVRRALDMMRADPDAPGETIALHLLDLSQIQGDLGLYADAEQTATEAVKVATASVGPEGEMTAAAIGALATANVNLGRLDKAEELSRRAMELTRKRFGDRSPRLAGMAGDLGHILVLRSRWADAEAVFSTALEIRREAYGPDHPRLASILEGLAGAQMALKKLDAAEASARKAYEIQLAQGEGRVEVAASALVYAKALQRVGKTEDAEALTRRALEIRERVLGDEHKLTAQAMETLGDLLVRQKKYDDARPILVRAVAVRRKALGDRHMLVTNGLRSLAVLSNASGDREAALGYLTEAESILDEAFNDDHQILISVRTALGNTLLALGRHEDAEKMLRAALEGNRTRHSGAGPEVADSLAALARALKAKGDQEGADAALREASEVRKAASAPTGAGQPAADP